MILLSLAQYKRARKLDGEVDDLYKEMSEGKGEKKGEEGQPETKETKNAGTKDLTPEIGEFCVIGSLKCRRIPKKVSDALEEYPHNDVVPQPKGALEVRGSKDPVYAALRSDGNTRNLRKLVIESPETWTAEFKAHVDAAKRAAKKAGRELDLMDADWPRDAKGKAWEVHHRKPLDFGGDNNPKNLIPIEKGIHTDYTTWWRSLKQEFGKYFSDAEWQRLIGGKKNEIFDPSLTQ